MKTTITIFLLATIFTEVLCVPFTFGQPRTAVRQVKPADDKANTPFCRLFQGPSRCVDRPLKMKDNEPWCPYRMCAPSYVPAELCPADKELQATNKCEEVSITRDIYKCDGKAFGHSYVPLGCTKGSPGCKEIPTCSCFKAKGVTSKILTDLGPFRPTCPTKP